MLIDTGPKITGFGVMGSDPLQGDITLSEGTDFSITQSGHDLTLTSRSSAGRNVTDRLFVTGTSAVDIPRMSFDIAASEVWSFEFNLNILPDGTSQKNGYKISWTVPSGATITSMFLMRDSSENTFQTEVLSGVGPTAAFMQSSDLNEGFWSHITGIVVNSTNAGTVQCQIRNVTSTKPFMVIRESYFTAIRIS